jgi:hypothetical protein
LPEHGDIETGEVEQLGHTGVGKQLPEIGRFILAGGELHRMAYAIARRQLRQAQPVAMRVKAEGLGIDGNERTQVEPFRQVALVKLDLHGAPIAQRAVN